MKTGQLKSRAWQVKRTTVISLRILCCTSVLNSQRYCVINDKADDKLPKIKLPGEPYTASSMILQCQLCLHSCKACIKITLSIRPYACNKMITDKLIFIKFYIRNAKKIIKPLQV
jgi:hypothetical protein